MNGGMIKNSNLEMDLSFLCIECQETEAHFL